MTKEKKPRLIVEEDLHGAAGGHVIAWETWVDDYDTGWEVGATLGDKPVTRAAVEARIARSKVEDDFVALEHDVACLAVQEFVATLPSDAARRDDNGWRFESRKHAEKARSVANQALKGLAAKAKAVLSKSPEATWPTWAIQAKNAGWKPPRGWKP